MNSTLVLTSEEARLLMHAVGFTISNLSARRAPGDRQVQDDLTALEAELNRQMSLQ